MQYGPIDDAPLVEVPQPEADLADEEARLRDGELAVLLSVEEKISSRDEFHGLEGASQCQADHLDIGKHVQWIVVNSC